MSQRTSALIEAVDRQVDSWHVYAGTRDGTEVTGELRQVLERQLTDLDYLIEVDNHND